MLNAFWGELGEATGAGQSPYWILDTEGTDLVVYPNRDALSRITLIPAFLQRAVRSAHGS